MPHDRPGNQMREIGNEQRVIQQAVIVRLAGIGIHQIADLLKGEKADGQRQEEMRHRQAQSQQIIGGAGKQRVVFEDGDQAQVEGQSRDQQCPSILLPGAAPLDSRGR